MALPNPPSIAVFPAAAQSAGCAALATVNQNYTDGTNWWQTYIFTATETQGWHFEKFTWDLIEKNQDGTIISSETGITATSNPSSGMSEQREQYVLTDDNPIQSAELRIYNLTAHFVQGTPTTYTITTAVSPSGAGTTTGDGTYTSGASCTLTATPASGYSFVRWEKNGAQVSTSASYTFTVSESATYTAVFATGVTVTLVATSFGRVRFEGDAAVHGTVSKSFAPGELVTIEAVTEYGSIFKQWRESYSGTVLTDARLIIFANDYVWTATFYHLYTAHARLAADIDTPCPNGQVRVVATETTTAWGRDVRYEKIDIQTLTIEQQSTGGGWTFVKWRYYSRYYERWYESTGATLRLVNYGYDIYALFQRTPTHLLVNSSTVESPAKLVYDPATNKLVADF